MSTQKPSVLIKDIDMNKITYLKAGKGGKLVYNYGTENDENIQEFKFSTNTMYSPFGINENQSKFSPHLEYSISASVNASEMDNAVATRESLELLDRRIEDIIKEKSGSLNLQDDYVYFSFYKNSGNYPKLIKFSFPRDTHGNFKTTVFDNDKKKIPLSDSNISDIFKKGSLFKISVINKKIWTYNGKVGTIWDIDQVKLIKNDDANQQRKNDNGNDDVSIEETNPTQINSCIMLD